LEDRTERAAFFRTREKGDEKQNLRTRVVTRWCGRKRCPHVRAYVDTGGADTEGAAAAMGGPDADTGGADSEAATLRQGGAVTRGGPDADAGGANTKTVV
jgi:hypothetical protein